MNSLAIGQSAKSSMAITTELIEQFAAISGDNNPIHLDQQYASTTRFKKPIAHGMLSASVISKVIGMQLPGPGTIYLSQTLEFKHPCYAGDTIHAEVVIIDKQSDKPIYTLKTICTNQDNLPVIEGKAIVFYKTTSS